MAADLKRKYKCAPVFVDSNIKEKYYKGGCGLTAGCRVPQCLLTSHNPTHPRTLTLADCAVRAGFCKQQLWPLFHYILPLSPYSLGRFDAELWQAYVKANKWCVRTGMGLAAACGHHLQQTRFACGGKCLW